MVKESIGRCEVTGSSECEWAVCYRSMAFIAHIYTVRRQGGYPLHGIEFRAINGHYCPPVTGEEKVAQGPGRTVLRGSSFDPQAPSNPEKNKEDKGNQSAMTQER